MSFELHAPPQAPRASDQTDASSLVDVELLETTVKEMYRRVAREPEAPRHFEVGADLALQLGYPAELIAAIPSGASESFAGVGYHLDLAGLRPGELVLDLGSGSGTDAFCAAVQVGDSGHVVGVDFTDAQVTKANLLGRLAGIENVSFVSDTIDDLPFANATFDVVISNGVINLSPVKSRVFEEAARVLRPGGRLAIADIVSERPLREGTRRNVDLWAACIAGAIPRYVYLEAIEKAGFSIGQVRANDYRFVSERARQAGDRYGVTSVSVAAVRRAD